MLEKHLLPTHKLSSNSWLDYSDIGFDIVITVCDNAANETCPLYLGNAIKAHWGIADPDKIHGKNRTAAFEKAFMQMKNRIEKMLQLKDINTDTLNFIGKTTL